VGIITIFSPRCGEGGDLGNPSLGGVYFFERLLARRLFDFSVYIDLDHCELLWRMRVLL
jgi:hypothetical protein